jgi:raffinose/stachyose/melibiose transport system permease protein
VKNRYSPPWYALFTLPLLLVFAMVVLVPFGIGIFYSFFSWDGLPLNPKLFVGADNYIRLFSDQRFLASAGHTALFTALSVLVINTLGLLFALLVTTELRIRNAVRTMLFAPYLIGGLILGYIWKFILGDAFRAIGEKTGLVSVFFNWLLDPRFALLALVVVITWQMAGYVMIVYITGIMAIPEEVIEAARVDGANPLTMLFRVKFPLLIPSITVSLFLSLSNCFKIFDVNLSLTNGGPYSSTELFAMNIYREIFNQNNYGYGQAKAILFFIIVASITLIQVMAIKKKEVEMK